MKRLNPSALQSKALCAKFEHDDTGDRTAADRGSQCHQAVASDDLNLAPEEMRGAVSVCQRIKADLIQECEDADVELKLTNGASIGLRNGYVDLLGKQPDRGTLYAVDWKFGQGEVEPAETNLQGKAYAAMLLRKHRDYHTVAVGFVQPYASDEPDVKVWTKADLSGLVKEIVGIYRRANDPAAEATPHPDACRYCAAAGTCDKLLGKLWPIADMAGIPETRFSEADRGSIFAAGLTWAPAIRKWLDSLKFHAKQWYEDHHEIPGFEAAFRQGNRRIMPETMLTLVRELDAVGIKISDVLAIASVPIRELEALASERLDNPGTLLERLEEGGVIGRSAPTLQFRKAKK